MSDRSIVPTVLLFMLLAGCASFAPESSPVALQARHELKDGSILIVDAVGRMRMFNVHGDPIFMKEGTPMELRDGSVIVMKENVIWKTLRTRGTLSPRS